MSEAATRLRARGRTVRRPAGALTILALAGIALITAAGGVLLWANRAIVYSNDVLLCVVFGMTSVAYAVSGFAIVRRAPGNAIGWLCLGIAAVLELGLTLSQYAIYAVRTEPGSLPAPGLALTIASPTPLLSLSGIVLVAHLFPTGRPIGRAWRPFVALTLLGGALAASGALLIRQRITDIWSDELSHAGVSASNPIGVLPVGFAQTVGHVGLPLVVGVGAVAAIASLVVRRRRAGPEERQQLRWLTAVAGAAGGWIVLMVPTAAILGWNGPAGGVFWIVATPLVALGPPVAIGIGIVKYRLFDIDVVIRKTVVVTLVAFGLTAAYLAVLALATLGNVSRLLVGVALLAVTFKPVRRGAVTIANRIAYGRRATSYEVLAGFSRRMADAYADDDVPVRMASILASGTGARSATVWLRVGRELRPETTVGEPLSLSPVPVTGDALPDLGPDSTEVRHDGELLGALTVVMPANDPLDNARRALIADMGAQAGLVLRNVRLIQELRGSRQRLVAAQDQERRRIERNIHDGAQQQLVALAVKLRLADSLVGRDDEKAHALLAALQTEAEAALDDLRDLARGIYPPLLADKGLVAAVEAQARKAPMPVAVEAGEVGRAGQDAEAAAYFCVLEAVQNAAKYAGTSSVTIRLGREERWLMFSVVDDGAGFDPATTPPGSGLTNMRDRLDALGGSVDVRSRPGAGTQVSGRIPITARSTG